MWPVRGWSVLVIAPHRPDVARTGAASLSHRIAQMRRSGLSGLVIAPHRPDVGVRGLSGPRHRTASPRCGRTWAVRPRIAPHRPDVGAEWVLGHRWRTASPGCRPAIPLRLAPPAPASALRAGSAVYFARRARRAESVEVPRGDANRSECTVRPGVGRVTSTEAARRLRASRGHGGCRVVSRGAGPARRRSGVAQRRPCRSDPERAPTAPGGRPSAR